jgi:DNA-binding transcriptional ArsR family regulator
MSAPPGTVRHMVASDARLAQIRHGASVERLIQGPALVKELAQPLSMSLPAVMQHLDVLEAWGLARSEKVSRRRTWHIEPIGLRTAED